MPFLFVYVCDLLEKLEIPFLREVGFLPGPLREYLRKHVSHWFTQHCSRLDAFSTDAQAVLSMLKPHNQVDRVYGIDPGKLELVIARALSLSKLQYLELQKWRSDPLGRDLAFFVQQVMKAINSTPSSERNHKVTAEDTDQVLLQIASFHPDSSPEVQSLASSWPIADHVSLLGELYQKIQPREGKWLTRQILKSLGPLKFPDDLELSASSGHSNLPQCLQVSIKMNIGSSAPVRRNGPMIARGHVPSSTAPVTTELITLANKIPFVPPLTPMSSAASSDPKPANKNMFTITHVGSIFPPTPPSSSLTPAPTSGTQAGAATNIPSTRIRSCPTPIMPTELPLTPKSSASVLAAKRNPLLQETLTQHKPEPISCTLSKKITSAQQHTRPVLGEISSNPATNSPATNSQASNSQNSSRTRTRHYTAGTGKCQLSTSSCSLKHCIFILSPCLITNPYIITSLLHWHGSSYITSISGIKHPSIPRRCPETGKRYLKIVLVESNAAEPTSKFLKQIVRLDGNEKRGGKKEWLRVYDWRLLESLGKADQGNVLSHDPWVRMFIGRI